MIGGLGLIKLFLCRDKIWYHSRHDIANPSSRRGYRQYASGLDRQKLPSWGSVLKGGGQPGALEGPINDILCHFIIVLETLA